MPESCFSLEAPKNTRCLTPPKNRSHSQPFQHTFPRMTQVWVLTWWMWRMILHLSSQMAQVALNQLCSWPRWVTCFCLPTFCWTKNENGSLKKRAEKRGFQKLFWGGVDMFCSLFGSGQLFQHSYVLGSKLPLVPCRWRWSSTLYPL